MSNTYPCFQELVNHAIVIDNKRKEMDAKKGSTRGSRRAATLAHVRILSRDSLSAIKDHRISGTMVSFLSAPSTTSSRATRTNNVPSSSMAIRISNAPSNRSATKHHAKECPTMLLERVRHPAATPMHVTAAERWDTMHSSAPRSRIHQPSKTRTAIRGLLDLRSLEE